MTRPGPPGPGDRPETQPTQPVQPVQPGEATPPTQPTQPTQPTRSTRPTQPPPAAPPPDEPVTVEVPELEPPTVAIRLPVDRAGPPPDVAAPPPDVPPDVPPRREDEIGTAEQRVAPDEPTIAIFRDPTASTPESPATPRRTGPEEADTAADRSTAPAGAGLGRASGIMALGTLASRVTGFLRTVALTAALGTALVGDAYNVANTTPNILYDLLLGGVLTSVVVPVLARAAREDDDQGQAFASSLLTLVVLGLSVVTVLGVVAAPLIVKLYISRPEQAELATTFLRYFLPQVVFYGIGATIGAILNLRNRFAAPMATPVLNNLIVIGTCIVFLAVADIRPDRIDSLSSGEIALLGIGTTLGIVVMTLALLPSLRASGFRYRPRLDLRHPGLRTAGRLAGWVLVFVVTSQVSLFVVTRLATEGVAYTTWFNAYQLFQLPHAIIAVSVITALLPRMSRHAAEERLDLVRDDLSTGLRLAAVVIVPAALGLFVLATPIAVAIFAHGATSVADAGRIGAALSAFAVALVPFSGFQLQLRAFYALADSRTPALINFAVAGTNIVAALTLSSLLPDRSRAVALALAFAAAYLVGSLVCSALLVRRLSGLDASRILRSIARAAAAGALAALLAYLVSRGVQALLGEGSAGSMVAVVAAGLVGGVAYLLIALRLRVEELTALSTMVRARLGR